ncbi:MAG: NUDIX hydrolase [Dehalococcoidia bacterium]
MKPSLSRRRFRLLLLLTIRYTPLPWDWKWRLIWLASNKVVLSTCALIRNPEGKILVLRSQYSGRWQFPGGAVKRREMAAVALRRECREELGLELNEARLTNVLPVEGGLSQCVLFAATLAPGRICLSEEHTDHRYLSLAELPENLRRIVANSV